MLRKPQRSSLIRAAVALGVGLLGLTSCGFGLPEPVPTTTTTTEPPPPPVPAIPAVALDAYGQVGSPCRGVDWAIVAGIGKVESDHGRIFGAMPSADGLVSPPVFGPELDGSGVGGNVTPLPAGEWAGAYGMGEEWLQAVGPMQFLPESFEIHGEDGNGDGIIDPHNLYDAVASAVNLLCSQSVPEDADPAAVLLAYNRSTDYQRRVLGWADLYRGGELFLPLN